MENVPKFKDIDPTKMEDPNEVLDEVIKIKTFMMTPEMVKLKKNDKNEFDRTIQQKFETFDCRFPTIINLLLKGSDMEPLYAMLRHLQNILDKVITAKEADHEVTDAINDKYLYKLLDAEDKKNVKAQVKKNMLS